MVCKDGSALVQITEADLINALELFFSDKEFTGTYKVSIVSIHRKGSEYPLTVKVKRVKP